MDTYSGLSPWATAEEILAAFGVTLAKAVPPPARRRRPINRIEDLRVSEISLVDVPANPYARIILMKDGPGPVEWAPKFWGPGPVGVALQKSAARIAAGLAQANAALERAETILANLPPAATTSPQVVPSAQAGAVTSREGLLTALRALGQASADAQGIVGQLDPASLLDLGLAAPGGVDLLRAIQAATD